MSSQNTIENAFTRSEHILATGTAQEYLDFTKDVEIFKDLPVLGAGRDVSVSEEILYNTELFTRCHQRRQKVLEVSKKSVQIFGNHFLQKFIGSHPRLPELKELIPIVFEDQANKDKISTLIFFASEQNDNLKFIFDNFKPQHFDISPAMKLFAENPDMYPDYLNWLSPLGESSLEQHKKMMGYFSIPSYTPYLAKYLKTLNDDHLLFFSGPSIDSEKNRRNFEKAKKEKQELAGELPENLGYKINKL